MEINKLCEKLFLLKDFNNEDNIEPFLDTVEKIVSLKEPRCIPQLLKYFDDDSDYGWVFQSMIHALETFPDEMYVKEIIKSIPSMLEKSPEWLCSLIFRILNHPPSLILFKKNMHLIPKETMIQLLDLVKKESEHHKNLCSQLRDELSRNTTAKGV